MITGSVLASKPFGIPEPVMPNNPDSAAQHDSRGACTGCSNGCYDILRTCPSCQRTPREKSDLRDATRDFESIPDILRVHVDTSRDEANCPCPSKLT